MESSTYRDLIETKISEWQNSIKKLEERIQKAGTADKEKIGAMVNELNAAVKKASLDLRQLEEQVNDTNALEIKEKILDIFDSVDKDLRGYEEKTPYML